MQTLTRANGGIVSWTPGSGSTPDTIVLNVPALASNAQRTCCRMRRSGPARSSSRSSRPTANGGVSSVNGITLHVLGTNGTGTNTVTYTPNVVNVPAPPAVQANPDHTLQNAIDAAPAGSLLVLAARHLQRERARVEAAEDPGPSGPAASSARTSSRRRDPEDPRFHVNGSVIDGRFFQQNASSFDATVRHTRRTRSTRGMPTILRGADITVVAKTATAYDLAPGATDMLGTTTARIDGLGLTTGHGDGAGGIQLQANINNMQLTNNVLENNGGVVAGGIGVGQPYAHDSHNYNVRIANDRLHRQRRPDPGRRPRHLLRLEQLRASPSSIMCSNFSVNYGAGISAHRAQPRRQDPRQPDLLQRLRRLRRRHRDRVRAAGPARPARRRSDPAPERWTSTAT